MTAQSAMWIVASLVVPRRAAGTSPPEANAGVRIPPQGFLSGLQEACRRAGALLGSISNRTRALMPEAKWPGCWESPGLLLSMGLPLSRAS